MSAFMVSNNHIEFMLNAAVRYGLSYKNTADHWDRIERSDFDKMNAMGKLLQDENWASVSHRYSDPSGMEEPTFEWHASLRDIDPVRVIKACHCYDYQSCEHPGWEGSIAQQFTARLISAAAGHLEGYDDAEWGIS